MTKTFKPIPLKSRRFLAKCGINMTKLDRVLALKTLPTDKPVLVTIREVRVEEARSGIRCMAVTIARRGYIPVMGWVSHAVTSLLQEFSNAARFRPDLKRGNTEGSLQRLVGRKVRVTVCWENLGEARFQRVTKWERP